MDVTDQENQQEFFPDFVKPSERKAEPRLQSVGRTQKPLLFSTTVEQILFASIIAILVLCTVYFLGILRGKSLVTSEGGPRSIKVSAEPMRIQPITASQPRVIPLRNAQSAPTAVLATPSRLNMQVATPSASEGRVLAATTASARPVASASNKKLYSIQIVTHKKRSFAEGELAAIGKAGFVGKIIESDGYFVVCVGQYGSKEEAKKDLAILKAKYADCFLRRF